MEFRLSRDETLARPALWLTAYIANST